MPVRTQEAVAARVEELLSQLTLREKISLLAGKDTWKTVPVPRLGIPSITMTDGPHGVRSSMQESGQFFTLFPPCKGSMLRRAINPF